MAQKGKRNGDCTILVVDDEPSIRDLLQLILQMDGYVIKTASNGQEALDSLESMQRPVMILLDLMMPVMNGWQFFAAVKADTRYSGIPVVVATAYSKGEIEMPQVEILPKPIDIALLRKFAGKYCNGK